MVDDGGWQQERDLKRKTSFSLSLSISLWLPHIHTSEDKALNVRLKVCEDHKQTSLNGLVELIITDRTRGLSTM